MLAIASPKRIREISDRTNWKITIEGGWKGDGLYEMVFFFLCRDIGLILNGSC